MDFITQFFDFSGIVRVCHSLGKFGQLFTGQLAFSRQFKSKLDNPGLFAGRQLLDFINDGGCGHAQKILEISPHSNAFFKSCGTGRFFAQRPGDVVQLLPFHQFKAAAGDEFAQRHAHDFGGVLEHAGFHGLFDFARHLVGQFDLQRFHGGWIARFPAVCTANSIENENEKRVLSIDTSGYQLKGQQSRIGDSITDGAFDAMMEAIQTDRTPNFYFMHYDLAAWSIKNLLLIPSFAFPPSAIIKRKPLSVTARRTGWIGCNFALNRIPVEARIAVVTTILSPPQSSAGVPPAPASNSSEGRRDACATLSRGERVVIALPAEVREKFKRVKPLSEISVKQRGWTLDVLNIVRRITEAKRQRAGAVQDASRDSRVIGKRASVLDCGGPPPLSSASECSEFTNEDVYAFTRELEQLHPGNRHIRDKIRQQLQVLRDLDLLLHIGPGLWRLP